jgi:hypothetical protein
LAGSTGVGGEVEHLIQADLRAELRQPPVSAMPVKYLAPGD